MMNRFQRYQQKHHDELLAYNRRWRAEHPERIHARDRKYYIKYLDRYRRLNRAYRIKHKDVLNARRRQRHGGNRDAENAKVRQYRLENRDKLNERRRLYRAKNRDRINAWTRKHKLENIQFRLAGRLRARLRRTLHYRVVEGHAFKNVSAVRDLGCTMQYFMAYIEMKFQPGMTWRNWGYRGWHIDHIRPLASFDLTLLEEQRKAVHYTNLQPLWAHDNLTKQAKYSEGGW